MLSNRYFPDTLAKEQLNMFWDGIFHSFTWIVTATGIGRLWKVAKYRRCPLDTNVLVGSMLAGWGLFNFVEGLIDHQLLALHHVVQRAPASQQMFYDLVFLASGIALIAGGAFLVRRGSAEERRPTMDGNSRAVGLQ